MTLDNSGNFRIQPHNIHGFTLVLLGNVGRNRNVVAVSGNLFGIHKPDKMLNVLALGIGIKNSLLIVGGQLVFVTIADKFSGSVNKQHRVVAFGFLQNDDAGGDGCSKEQVRRQLDDRINVVVVNQILPDFLFRSSTVQHAGKFDDGRRAVHRQP